MGLGRKAASHPVFVNSALHKFLIPIDRQDTSSHRRCLLLSFGVASTGGVPFFAEDAMGRGTL